MSDDAIYLTHAYTRRCSPAILGKFLYSTRAGNQTAKSNLLRIEMFQATTAARHSPEAARHGPEAARHSPEAARSSIRDVAVAAGT